jgi:hypothetical protein
MNRLIRTPLKCPAIAGIVMALTPSTVSADVANSALSYLTNTGICTYVFARLTQYRDRIWISGLAATYTQQFPPCSPYLEVVGPPYTLAVSYTLWKWNGSSTILCSSNPGYPGWFYNFEQGGPGQESPGSDRIKDEFGQGQGYVVVGCGPGPYNVGVHGYYLDGSTWRGGTVYSGWDSMNIPEPPPPPK